MIWLELHCDEPEAVEGCVSKFGSSQPAQSSGNERQDVSAVVGSLRKTAIERGWVYYEKTKEWRCPKCAEYHSNLRGR